LHRGDVDVNAMLRLLFSRLGEPHIGSSNAFSFNVPSVKATGNITVEKGAGPRQAEERTFEGTGGMCPRCEGMGSVNDIDLSQVLDETRSLSEGAITIPGYTADGWYVKTYMESGFLDPKKPISAYSEQERQDLLYREPVKVKVSG